MKRVKLGACLIAASVSLGGAAFLATPVEASTRFGPCSEEEQAFADGYAAGFCAAHGYDNGEITSCESNGDGTITISGECSNE